MQSRRQNDQVPAHDYGHALDELIRSSITLLSAAQFKLGVHLYAAMKDKGGCVEASTAALAAATGLSGRTVQACRTQLINNGLLCLSSTGRERGVYDLPKPVSTGGEPEPGPDLTEETDLQRVALLTELVAGNQALVSAATEAAGGCTARLLLALEWMVRSGHRFDPAQPELFLAAITHRSRALASGFK